MIRITDKYWVCVDNNKSYAVVKKQTVKNGKHKGEENTINLAHCSSLKSAVLRIADFLVADAVSTDEDIELSEAIARIGNVYSKLAESLRQTIPSIKVEVT